MALREELEIALKAFDHQSYQLRKADRMKRLGIPLPAKKDDKKSKKKKGKK